MKLPEIVYSLGARYEVVRFDSNTVPADFSGAMQDHRRRITVDVSQPEQRQWEILFHEAIEIINERLELKLRHPQIQSLEAGLIDFARGNPGAWRNIAK